MTCKFRFFYNKCITQYIKSLLNTSYNELLQSIFNLDSHKFFLTIKSSFGNRISFKFCLPQIHHKKKEGIKKHERNSRDTK